jgi:hypothetical protein
VPIQQDRLARVHAATPAALPADVHHRPAERGIRHAP